jgi:hypothetical protein
MVRRKPLSSVDINVGGIIDAVPRSSAKALGKRRIIELEKENVTPSNVTPFRLSTGTLTVNRTLISRHASFLDTPVALGNHFTSGLCWIIYPNLPIPHSRRAISANLARWIYSRMCLMFLFRAPRPIIKIPSFGIRLQIYPFFRFTSLSRRRTWRCQKTIELNLLQAP